MASWHVGKGALGLRCSLGGGSTQTLPVEHSQDSAPIQEQLVVRVQVGTGLGPLADDARLPDPRVAAICYR